MEQSPRAGLQACAESDLELATQDGHGAASEEDAIACDADLQRTTLQGFDPAVAKVLNSMRAIQAAAHGPVMVCALGAARTQSVVAPEGVSEACNMATSIAAVAVVAAAWACLEGGLIGWSAAMAGLGVAYYDESQVRDRG